MMDNGFGVQKRPSLNKGPVKPAIKKLPASRAASNNELSTFPVLKGNS
jgi:cyclin B